MADAAYMYFVKSVPPRAFTASIKHFAGIYFSKSVCTGCFINSVTISLRL